MTRISVQGCDGDVAVIGAGLAGLAAAHRLRSRDRRPVVFEATDRVGGRQRSSPLGGTVLEEGAVFFGRRQYPDLWRWITAFGLEPELKTYDTVAMRPIEDQRPDAPARLRRPLAATPLASLARDLPAREKLKLLRTMAVIAPRGGQLRRMLGTEAESPWLGHLDTMTAKRWFDDAVGPRFTSSITSPLIESLSFADATEWSALGALMLMTFSASPSLNAILGGNDRIAKGIAEHLDVRTANPVTAVLPRPERRGRGARGRIVVADDAVPRCRGGCAGSGGGLAAAWRTRLGRCRHPLQLLGRTRHRHVPTASKVIRWRDSIPIGEPGMRQRQHRIRDLAAGVAHLELAGDYLVSPSQEGAMVSGSRAADSLLGLT